MRSKSGVGRGSHGYHEPREGGMVPGIQRCEAVGQLRGRCSIVDLDGYHGGTRGCDAVRPDPTGYGTGHPRAVASGVAPRRYRRGLPERLAHGSRNPNGLPQGGAGGTCRIGGGPTLHGSERRLRGSRGYMACTSGGLGAAAAKRASWRNILYIYPFRVMLLRSLS
ncbi:hypothetical protein GOBAR_DD08483 [Gossypium barbadense]|nr:hypothetical protein GOBAR_DD08483 [Gossypium barbadense]